MVNLHLAIFTGPVITLLAYNLVPLYFHHRLTSLTVTGMATAAGLAVVPFLGVIALVLLRSDPLEGKRDRIRMQANCTYVIATLATSALFFWSAYAEEGPYRGGGAAMSIVGVLILTVPIAIVTASLGILIGWGMYRHRISRNDS